MVQISACSLEKWEASITHPTIPTEIAPFVKIQFEELSDDSLLQWGVLGATQYQNDSFKSLI